MQAEARRAEKLAEIEADPKVGSRFARDTTVAELIAWWLDSVARHQVKTSTLDRYAPFTVLNCRKVCRQAFMEAVKVGLISSSPFDLVKAPKARRVNAGRVLTPDEAKALIRAAEPLRLGAAVTLLFCQGWRGPPARRASTISRRSRSSGCASAAKNRRPSVR